MNPDDLNEGEFTVKTKRHRYQAVVLLLSGGMLLGSGSCVPEDFWADLVGTLITSAADTVVVGAVDNALHPAARTTQE